MLHRIPVTNATQRESALGPALLDISISELEQVTSVPHPVCVAPGGVDRQHTWGLGCHAEGPGQAGGLGLQEPHEAQQGQMPSPACGKDGGAVGSSWAGQALGL